MSKRILRLLSFAVKEIIDVLQQPRLVLTLIVGPFLILLVFGMGFTGRNRPVEAIVVVPPEAQLPADIREQALRYEDFMPIHAVLKDRDEALVRLQAGEVDMVAVLPSETYGAFLSGRQIVIEILINEYDPVRVQWVHYVSGYMSSDLNRQLLSEAIRQGKVQASQLQGISVVLLDQLVLVGEAVEANDLELAKERVDEMLDLLDQETMALGLDEWTTSSVLPVPGLLVQQLLDLRTSLRELEDELRTLRQTLDEPDFDPAAILAQVKAARDAVSDMQAIADLLERIPVEVLVSPLKTEVENVSPYTPDFLGFYTPAVLALLLQHIAVSFGALTMVRERLLGAEELFRVAPIAPWEIITGKFVSYCMLTVSIGVVLSVLIVAALHVPLLGSVFNYLLVLSLVTVASLGWGFVISLLSSSEIQSVQLSMLVLIASVFFGGFFLPLAGLRPAVHAVSYALPVTYGIQALREIMLAGRAPGADTLLPLAGLGLGFYVVSMLIYAWQNKRE